MDSVNKTLYIPLYGKAFVSRRGLFFRDEMAETIWDQQGFPLKGKAKSKWLAYNMAMRAVVFDRWLQEKMEEVPEAVILHIGCGLDSRISRVGNRDRLWYDIDFPEVIAERKAYFPETEGYRMVGADIRRKDWLEGIPEAVPAIVVMEGVSMYLTMEELLAFAQSLQGHFSGVTMLMDTYTVFAAKATRYKNPINQVGVTEVHGFDDPSELTKGNRFRFLQEHDLTPESLIGQLPKQEQGFFRTMFAGKLAKKIYRLYSYETR